MSRIGIMAAAFAGACLLGIVFLAGQPMVSGADGVVSPTTVSWSSILMSLFTGSTVASIAAFWRTVQPAVATITHTIAPGIPVPPADVSHDIQSVTELLAAVTAYTTTGDTASQRRMVVAIMTEIGDIAETQSPEIRVAINAVMIAITAKWFPATEVAK